ncbi:MAG: hypothetical protein ACKO0Z_28690 [Betaproteobacteria bacterium]
MPRALNAELLSDPRAKVLIGILLTEITNLRTSLATLTAKLDNDAGVTDTNYTALCTPPASQLTQ